MNDFRHAVKIFNGRLLTFSTIWLANVAKKMGP